MIKIKDGEVRPGRCIPPNWNDIRAKFGYTMLYKIRLGEVINKNYNMIWKEYYE